MSSITIDLPTETYKRLEAQARSIGQDPETLSRDLLISALQSCESARAQTTGELLRAAGRVRPLSKALRDKITPAVTLEETRTILKQASGPALSEIIQDQRGSKA